MPRDFLTRVLHGALAGANGAATMTVLRMVAHRAGLIDQMVPQKVEQWARRKTGKKRRAVAGSYRVVDHVLHVGYGATWGAILGAVQPSAKPSVVGTLGFGIGVWALGSMVIFPALRVGPPAWRSGATENTVNVAAHLLYAGVTSFLLDEFSRQPMHDIATRRQHHGRVG